jgi:hypothetical protein
MGLVESCLAEGQTCGGLGLSCTSALNCQPGDSCCLGLGSQGAGATCEPACKGLGVQLCLTDGECPMGEACLPIAGGISVCRRGFGF